MNATAKPQILTYSFRVKDATTSKQVKMIHAKSKNKRQDDHHKLSDQLLKENGLIVVGD